MKMALYHNYAPSTTIKIKLLNQPRSAYIEYGCLRRQQHPQKSKYTMGTEFLPKVRLHRNQRRTRDHVTEARRLTISS